MVIEDIYSESIFPFSLSWTSEKRKEKIIDLLTEASSEEEFKSILL